MTSPLPSTPTGERPAHSDQAIVIFDGVCGLCNSSVDFILRHDAKQRFVFAPNQSDAAQELLIREGLDLDDVDTIYLFKGGVMYNRSTAVVHIAGELAFPWRLGVAGRLVPRPARDWLYAFVATRRYRWFGKHETCRIPTPDERARFLD